MTSDVVFGVCFLAIIVAILLSNGLHLLGDYLESKAALQKKELEVRILEAQARLQEHERK